MSVVDVNIQMRSWVGKHDARSDERWGSEKDVPPHRFFGSSGSVATKTGEKEGGDKESWHNANEDGWEMAYKEAREKVVAERSIEARGGADRNRVGSQPE